MRFWKSKDLAACPQNGADTETVRQKLAACEQGIAQAEADLRAISLQAALSEDPDAGHDAVARVNALRSKRELLTNALQAAEQAERERLAALHAREWQARKRSLAQKTGQLERDAAELAAATQALHDARSRMATTASSIAALLPSALRTNGRPWDALMSPMMTRQLALLEGYRLDPTAQKPDRLANHYPDFQDRASGRIKSIGEITAEFCTNLKADYERCGLSAEQPQQPMPLQTAAPESSGVVVSLQGVDAQTGLPKPKVTQDAAEGEEEEQFCDQVAKEVTADA